MENIIMFIAAYLTIGTIYAIKRARDQYILWAPTPRRAEEEIVHQTPVTVFFWPIFLYVIVIAYIGKGLAGCKTK